MSWFYRTVDQERTVEDGVLLLRPLRHKSHQLPDYFLTYVEEERQRGFAVHAVGDALWRFRILQQSCVHAMRHALYADASPR